MDTAPVLSPADPLAQERARAAWQRAMLAARLFAVDPAGLGGLVLRARAGPVRATWLEMFETLALDPLRRVPPDIADERLLGGLDLTATLRAGRPVHGAGLLDEARAAGAILVLPMAERVPQALAGRLAQALDQGRGTGPALLALDEGAEDDERAPATLTDRMALWIDLDAIPLSIAYADPAEALGAPIAAARQRLPKVETTPEQAEALTAGAAALGIGSLRAPLMALQAARILAALDGQTEAADGHVELAAALILAPRATALPQPDQSEDPPPPEEPPDDDQTDRDRQEQQQETGQLEDRVMDAARAVLPPDFLTGSSGRSRGQSARAGAGVKQAAPSHGRPAGTRPGAPDGRHRLDVLATLRQAAPWQSLRRSAADPRSLVVTPDDFQIKRHVRPAESVLIFLVDASGSAAAARLAEAKGAVELMLAEAYQRREKVALIAFRGTEADLMLPPTRALVAAKRKLAVLPGGGGTPLAAGLLAGLGLGRQIRRDGATPYLIALTDGRGNIALDGTPGRAQAAEDAETAARAIAAEALDTVLIDTANRPQRAAEALARLMGGRYLPLPRADARGLSQAIRVATGA